MNSDSLVRNYMTASVDDVEDATDIIKELASRIDANQLALLDLVKYLGDFLTADDIEIRARGLSLLSSIIPEINPKNITRQQVTVLLSFYVDRLGNDGRVDEVLSGLIALQALPTFVSSDASTTSQGLFKEVNVQKHTQATRYLVFKLLDALLAKYRPALVKLGSSFINGFIKAVDGEKDPRNLLLVFAMSRVIALEFDITTHVEDLFDVTFCYFPITFRPPPDDPYGITADDLRNSLRKSLAASPLYGPLAMPLLLEKLTSTSGPAKKDSLETLNACIPVYGASAVNEVMKTLVDNLRYEVINSGEDLVETLALQVIKTTVATVSDLGTEIAPPPTLLVLLRMLLDDAADQLKEPDQKMAKPAGRILAVAASASVIACAEVVVEVVPVLLSQLDESDLAVRKKAILEILSEFLNASAECFGSRTNEITREQQNPLFEYKDQLYIACTRALKASTEYPGLRLAGLAGLRAMLSLRDYLDDSESAMTVQILDDVLLKNIEDEELKTETLAVLVHVATFSPHHIVDLTLPFLLATLPTSKEDLDFAQAMGLKAQYHSVLASLSNFSAEQPIFDTLVSSLLHKLAHIATYPMDDISYPKAVCSTLLDMLKIKAAKKDPSIPELKDSLAMPLLRTCIAASLGLDELSPASCMAQVEILQDIAGMHMLIARSLDVNQQGILMRGIVWAFKDGDLNALEFDDLALPGVKFQPLSPAAPYAQQNISPIFASVVGSCRRDVELPIQDVCAFLETLAKDSVTTENEEQRLAYLRTIGSMVNKVQDSSKLDAFLSGPIKSLWDGISSVDEKQRRPRMLLYAWIIKGLVLRSHNAGYQMLDNIVKAMQDGFDFAEAFQVIVTPDEQVLNRQSFADVRLLYQQRLFNFLLPRLLNGFKTARSNPDTDSLATKYLIAMTYVLKHVPKQLLVNEITLLLPLLLHALSTEDPELKCSAIDTFCMLSIEAPEVMAGHVSTIIPQLLGAVARSKSNTATVRLSALKCLGVIGKRIRYDALHPYKATVVRHVVVALDDSKRVVRREAVDCRSVWFLLSAK